MTIESQPVKNLSLSMKLQKTLKMTNKAILKIDQMNVTISLTSDYNRVDTWCRGKNKAISKPFCLFLMTILLSTAGFADTQNPKELPNTYGSAIVEKVNTVLVGYTFLCDIKDWPKVIGTNIRVTLDRLVPPAIVTKQGKQNNFFDLQTKKFIASALSNANKITLNNIKRAENFGIIAEVIVDSNSLAELLIDNGLAEFSTDKETAIKKEQTHKITRRKNFVKTQPAKKEVSGWTASKNSKIFHNSLCSVNNRISAKNLIKFDSRNSALQTGRRPCKTCKP